MKKAMTIIGIILLVFIVVAAVLVIRTATYKFGGEQREINVERIEVPALSQRSIDRFAGGIRIPTISESISQTENNPFDRFREYLPKAYPSVYANTDTLTINRYGLVFRWAGRNSGLDPILFCSHYDVVPVVGYVEEDSDIPILQYEDTPADAIDEYKTEWEYPAFSGAVVNGRIYGRGTLDMKGMLFGIMEAADALIEQGFVPERDIWFAFGFDEEIGGLNGALKIAEYFKQQGITFDAVYDEGGIVAAPGLGGINRAVALVGTAEKGFCTLNITVRGTGGHSSMPPAKGSLVLASEIIQKLNDNQMPARLTGPISSFLDNTGDAMGYMSRMAIANKWLFGPMLLKTMSKSPQTNALVRTTTAVTMARGSDAPNVMASTAEITVNFRILSGESVADVVKHVEDICSGYDTEIQIANSREPSNISPEEVRGFEVIQDMVGKLYPDAQVTSYITIGGADAYKYEAVSKNVYRFMPVYLNEFEQRTIHNENEYISFDNFARMIAYFKGIMENY